MMLRPRQLQPLPRHKMPPAFRRKAPIPKGELVAKRSLQCGCGFAYTTALEAISKQIEFERLRGKPKALLSTKTALAKINADILLLEHYRDRNRSVFEDGLHVGQRAAKTLAALKLRRRILSARIYRLECIE